MLPFERLPFGKNVTIWQKNICFDKKLKWMQHQIVREEQFHHYAHFVK